MAVSPAKRYRSVTCREYSMSGCMCVRPQGSTYREPSSQDGGILPLEFAPLLSMDSSGRTKVRGKTTAFPTPALESKGSAWEKPTL
jgi:hypothetical protein